MSGRKKICLLMSAGIDSSILAADLLRNGCEVYPLYVRCGFRWEKVELRWLRRLLAALARPALRPLAVRSVPMAEALPGHWSTSDRRVPGARSRDESVYLPGRNLVLCSQAGVHCGLEGIPAIALGVLRGNPFPDARPGFLRAMSAAIGLAFSRPIRVIAPYACFSKRQVLARAGDFPLELTFSCLRPAGLAHCGACNKCAERELALRLSSGGAASAGGSRSARPSSAARARRKPRPGA